MVEALEFIFRDFWTFAGTVVLISVFGASLAGVMAAVIHGKSAE